VAQKTSAGDTGKLRFGMEFDMKFGMEFACILPKSTPLCVVAEQIVSPFSVKVCRKAHLLVLLGLAQAVDEEVHRGKGFLWCAVERNRRGELAADADRGNAVNLVGFGQGAGLATLGLHRE
jgi:hypothetical protein